MIPVFVDVGMLMQSNTALYAENSSLKNYITDVTEQIRAEREQQWDTLNDMAAQLEMEKHEKKELAVENSELKKQLEGIGKVVFDRRFVESIRAKHEAAISDLKKQIRTLQEQVDQHHRIVSVVDDVLK